mgnify:FL=1
MTTESSYIPGMCNINTKEVAYRRKAMWFGVILSMIMLLALALLNAPWWLGILILFIPVYIGAIGYLQVTNRFCVSYGASGRQNADEDSDSARTVEDNEALEADKAKTRKMNLQAFGITIVILVASAILLHVF